MPETNVLYSSKVTEDQIDSLGHMNVRYYVSRMVAANDELLRRSGLLQDGKRIARRVDTYTRFHREQFTGATLNVLGGFVEPIIPLVESQPGVDAYFEIRNPESDQVAASFLIRTLLLDVRSLEPVRPPSASELAESDLGFEVPTYGQPRSLDLSTPRSVNLADLEAAIPEEPVEGMMSGRRDGEVLPEDCGPDGYLSDDIDLMFLIMRAMVRDGTAPMGPPVQTDSQGRRFSWAMMETRSVQYSRPKAGDAVVTIGGDIAWSDRWRQSRRWTFVRDTGVLLGIADSLGICIDLDARKSLPVPEELMAQIEKNGMPQFA